MLRLKLSAGAKSLMVAACVVSAMVTPSAQGAFHLWTINEIYTNNTGTLQFIELTDTFGGQNFIGGQQVQVSNIPNTQTNTFNIPAGVSLGGSTLGHSLLFGTAGVQAAGGPAPDFILPNGFLFSAGGTIVFFGLNSGPYAALPTDGIHSRLWSGGDAVNTPTNYAGQTGTLPSPATLALIAAGGGMMVLRGRRRSA